MLSCHCNFGGLGEEILERWLQCTNGKMQYGAGEEKSSLELLRLEYRGGYRSQKIGGEKTGDGKFWGVGQKKVWKHLARFLWEGI